MLFLLQWRDEKLASIVRTQSASALANRTVLPILLAISMVHMLNDSMQAVVPALYPILEKSLQLSYVQLGWITFMLNMTSSVMQPVVGLSQISVP
jgi:FSR family fosmidomycin resistance protein-like MFS transporter